MNIHPAVCTYSEVAPYLRKNKYIRHGYRANYNTAQQCLLHTLRTPSNETFNIAICLLGGFLFVYQGKVVNNQVLPWYKYTTAIDYLLMTLQVMA